MKKFLIIIEQNPKGMIIRLQTSKTDSSWIESPIVPFVKRGSVEQIFDHFRTYFQTNCLECRKFDGTAINL